MTNWKADPKVIEAQRVADEKLDVLLDWLREEEFDHDTQAQYVTDYARAENALCEAVASSGSPPSPDGLIVFLRTIELVAALAQPAGPTESAWEQFGRWVLKETQGENCGNDLDGGDVQDKLVEVGILVGREVTEPCDPDICQCAEFGLPTTCYTIADQFAVAPVRSAPAPEDKL